MGAKDIFLHERRDREEAEALFRRLVEGQPVEPRVVGTDKLASYALRDHFRPGRHLLAAGHDREILRERCAARDQITGVAA